MNFTSWQWVLLFKMNLNQILTTLTRTGTSGRILLVRTGQGDVAVPEWPVPVRVSDLISTARSRSKGSREARVYLRRGQRRKWPGGGRSSCRGSAARFQGVLGFGKGTRTCGAARRTRGWPQRLQASIPSMARHCFYPMRHRWARERTVASISCTRQQGKESGDSHGYEEGREQQGSGGNSLISPESTRNGRGQVELRRAISASSGHDWIREKRGKEEEGEGFIAIDTRQGEGALIARIQIGRASCRERVCLYV